MSVSRPFRCRVLAVALPLAAFCLVISGNALAQPVVDVSPYVGLYVPMSSVAEAEDEFGGSQSSKHDVAAAFGARVSMSLGSRLGLEVAASYSPGHLIRRIRFSETSAPLTASKDEASVSTVTARALWRVVNGERTSLHVLAGPGIVSRGGTAYERAEDTTVFAVAVGAGLLTRVGSRVAIRWDLENYVSRPDLGVRGEGARTQHDFVFSQSLSIRVGAL